MDFNEFVNNIHKLNYYFKLKNGKVVSSYPIITGFFNLPVYLIAKFIGVDLYKNRFFLSLISSSLISALSVVFLYNVLVLLRHNEKLAFHIACIFAFATYNFKRYLAAWAFGIFVFVIFAFVSEK